MTWDILMCSIWERTNQLNEILTELKHQIQPGVRVIVARDNLEMEYGPKCQALLEASSADYISYLDDDDMVAPDFISRILKAMEEDPDYIGFRVRYTTDGVRQLPVTHSLEYDGWINTPTELFRDIVHFNPVRRTIGVQSSWTGDYAADRRWTDGLRGLLKTQVFIDDEMHYYQHSSTDSFLAVHTPMDHEPPRPQGFDDFVTWI